MEVELPEQILVLVPAVALGNGLTFNVDTLDTKVSHPVVPDFIDTKYLYPL